MKLREGRLRVGECHVAPRAGAWIETQVALGKLPGPPVAPRAGAWIETHTGSAMNAMNESPPARGRGLKLSVWDR